MENYNHEEFEHWVDLWDQARNSEEFQKSSNQEVPAAQQGIASNETPQDFYWNHLSGLSNENEVLNEEKTPNPVYPDSVGKDQEKPEPSWVKEDFIEEISDLKRELHDLKVKLSEEDGGNGEWVEKCHHPEDSKLLSQIKDLESKIDTLSNKLGVEDEPAISKWEVGNNAN